MSGVVKGSNDLPVRAKVETRLSFLASCSSVLSLTGHVNTMQCVSIFSI